MAKLYLVLSVAIFGTVGVFVKYIPLPSAYIAAVRGAIGALFMLGAILLKGRKPDRKAIRANIKLLVFSGVCMGINWILLFQAYKYTSVAAATLYYYLAPVFMIVLSPVLLHEKLTIGKLLCVAAAMLGVAAVSGVLGGEGLGSPLGALFGVSSAVFYAACILSSKFFKDISSYDSTFVQLICAAAVSLPYAVITGGEADLSDTRGIVMLIIVGLIHTGVAYYLYFYALSKLPGQTVALFSYVDPAVAVILSMTLLREPMTVSGVVGAVLILGSTVAGELLDRKPAG